MVTSLSAPAFADEALHADVGAALVAVEEMLFASVKSDYPFVTETARHLMSAGGKRFRPMLVFVASHFGDPSAAGLVEAATAIELTHLATLYHDDVMDEAVLRRGAPSANLRWTNAVAILTGDFLFSRASEITSDLGAEPIRILSRTLAVLCEGQIRESVGPGSGEDPVEHYLQVLGEKTGALIASSGRLGGLLGGADPSVVEVLTRYGELIGIAFQISDDLLDITSDSPESGKTPGTDLREGVHTLPVLYALEGVPASSRLFSLLAGDLADEERLRETLTLLRAHPAIGRARETLRRYADEARTTLDPLPDVPAKEALDAVCDFVVDRTR